MSRFYAIASRARNGKDLNDLTRRGHPNGLAAKIFTRWGTLSLLANVKAQDRFGAFLNDTEIASFTEDTETETAPAKTTGNHFNDLAAPRFVIKDYSRSNAVTNSRVYASDEDDKNGDYTGLLVQGWNAGIYARLHTVNPDGSVAIDLYRNEGSQRWRDTETFIGSVIIGPVTRWNPAPAAPYFVAA